MITGFTARAAVVVVLAAGVAAPLASPAAAAPTCLGHRATIVGTRHADTIHGTPGNDVIVAGDNPDVVYGEGGNDIICGGSGVYETEDGDVGDRLYGGPGRDIIAGGADHDEIYGGPGADTLYGQDGNDLIVDGPGDDHAYGGRGDDGFIAGGGDDVLIGGPHNEHVGLNYVTYYRSPRGVHIDLAADTATGDGHDVVGHIWTAYGSNHDDVILGTAHSDHLAGMCGNDVVRGRGGTDYFYPWPNEGCGADTPDLDHTYGGDGNDIFYGADAGAAQESDRFYGDAGNDVLHSAGGGERFDGGAGTDMLDMQELYFGSSSLQADLAAHTYQVGDSNGILVSVEDLIGTDHDDTLNGSAADNTLIGAPGNDTLRGRAGDDVLHAEYLPGYTAPRDVADGGPGNDRCSATYETSCETSERAR